MSDSVSFDRAASLYDSTRVTDEETLRVTVDLLNRDVAIGEGPVFEIGVGTEALPCCSLPGASGSSASTSPAR